ncbi:MAG TPA: TrmH family RNA methyltransferase [bacterium]|nr:TrmH family RNA methyltransferase [bacterium]
MRGYACIGLHNPKNYLNVGRVLRACGNFNVAMLAVAGNRHHYKKACTDTMKAYRSIPFLLVDDIHKIIPYDCIPVAIEILPDAKSLIDFKHPERAFYIFGPEDGSLGKDVLSWCKYKVFIPTHKCMNLAATVHVVLYDRVQKQLREYQ